ncbi:MAG TPA: hypothetical protein VGC20_14850 [bacterium]|jgi:hypothetical protein
MTALAKDRVTPRRSNEDFSLPVAAGAVIHVGALVALSATGYATPGAVAATLQPVGVAQEAVDNTGGADGAKTVKVRNGAFRFANSGGGDLIALTEVGAVCYIVDDQTVAKTDNGGARSPAGMVVDVDGDGVWVFVGYGPVSSPAGTLLAANNLSDVDNAATSRANLGANQVPLVLRASDLVGGNAAVYRVVSPVAGLITKIWSVLSSALATGDATLTASIGGTPVTNGAITITQAGSAAGDVDSATPSAANAVVAGDVIEITVGGTNSDAAAEAEVTLYIET